MFDHCDTSTTAVIDTALAEARRLGHRYVGTEHLLVALCRRADLLPAAVTELLPAPEDVLSGLATEIGVSPHREADLLRVLGVDLDQVRSAARRTFGDDAVAQLGRRRVHQPWQPWRRPSHRCTSLLAGTMTPAPRLKQALELARSAAERSGASVRPVHLLLGMVDVEDAMANRLLMQAGADRTSLRARLVELS